MSEIKNFLSDNQEMTVQVTSEVGYNIVTVIDDVYRAVNAKFEDSKWSDGSDKEYFDLSRVMAVSIKNETDIDTKDLGVHAEIKEAVGTVGLIRGVIKNHLKVNKYGTLFNRVRDDLVDYGHVILKKTKEGTETVDLRNIVRPADGMDIQKVTFVEKHSYSYQDMLQRKSRWEDSWDIIEAVRMKMRNTSASSFTVYEMWTIDEFDGQVTKGFINYLDTAVLKPEESDSQADWQPQVELERKKTPYTVPVNNEKKRKELEKQGYLIDGELPVYPYSEQRLFEVKGRWLGAGVYEITAPLRRAYNRTMNNKIHYDETFGKGLFTHTKGMGGKALTQSALQALENSGVVEIQNGATLEQMRLQSLTTDFIISADKFFEFARQLLGLTAQGTGEELPASMSATSAMINKQKSKTLFDFVIEQQDLLWSPWFSDFELADIMEDLTFKKWVKIEGNEQEIREIVVPFAKNYVNAEVGKKAPALMGIGAIEPAPEIPEEDLKATVDEVVELILEKKSVFVEFTNKLVEQSRFYLEFYISGEGFNKMERLKTLTQLKADAMVNPNSTLDVGAIEDEILDIVGVGISRFKRPAETQLLPPVAPTPPTGEPVGPVTEIAQAV